MRLSTRFFKLGTLLSLMAILSMYASAAPPDGKGGGKDKGGDDGGDSNPTPASTFYVRYDNGGGWQRTYEYRRGEAYSQDESFLGRVAYSYGQPSELIYGSDSAYDRWFCQSGYGETLQVVQTQEDGTEERLYELNQSEIIMTRSFPNSGYSGNIDLQITNLFDDGILVHGYSTVQWSNDGLDSFVSVIAEDISQFTLKRRVFYDGNEYPYIDLSEANRTSPKLYRFHISGADVEEGVQVDPETGELSFPNKFGAGIAEEISLVETIIRMGGGLEVAHDWSPDGTALVYRDFQDGNLYLITDLDTNSPAKHLIWSNVGSGSGIYFNVDWSPTSPLGDQIVFNGTTADGNGICLTPIDLDSTSPVGQTILAMAEDDKGWGHYYSRPCWSPDGTIFAAGVFQVDNRGDKVVAGSRQVDLLTGRQSDILNNLWLEFWRGNNVYVAP